ncbi:hypothetical protein FYJ26_04180 [Anaerococcus sp. WCA-380-WT-2B]|uniref:Lipoprotein n=1 Tax=Anaerococcus porci TaxID=2652269 RepID=A0A6N7VRZ7_9FIRM|nr:hypothetical protein [Anaerococcus porci]MSS77612.1 hypothetical protein [Anaerococcus porci]
MRKHTILLCLLSLYFLFTSCQKPSESSLKNGDKETIKEKVNIKYVGKEKTFENTNKKKSFEQKYGKGRKSPSINLDEAVGNLVSAKIANIDLGLSLLPSTENSGSYSIFVNYEDKNNNLGLDEEKIEIGPIFDEDKSYSLISFYKMTSPSGDILIISQVQISDDFQYSKYSIYNKYLNMMDYAYFYNSNQNIYPTSIRSDAILDEAEDIEDGDINIATKMRVKEDKYLKDLFKTYNIENISKKANIENSEMVIANFTKESDKIIKILSIEKLKNGKFAIK